MEEKKILMRENQIFVARLYIHNNKLPETTSSLHALWKILSHHCRGWVRTRFEPLSACLLPKIGWKVCFCDPAVSFPSLSWCCLFEKNKNEKFCNVKMSVFSPLYFHYKIERKWLENWHLQGPWGLSFVKLCQFSI